jgi:ubiquitin carboxyl-terminal hydrolase L3
MSESRYAAHFVPLESDPHVFDSLIHGLGASPNLTFQEVYTLDEPDQLPHPALALILILPTSTTYERHKAVEESTTQENTHDDGEVVWFKQTINNACGLYAILHAICNGDGRQFIGTLYLTRFPIIELNFSRAGVIFSEPHQH